MSRRRNHVSAGLVFILACVVIGVGLFLVIKSADQPSAVAVSNQITTAEPELIPADPENTDLNPPPPPPPPPPPGLSDLQQQLQQPVSSDTSPITPDPVAAVCADLPALGLASTQGRVAWCGCIHNSLGRLPVGSAEAREAANGCEIMVGMGLDAFVQKWGPPHPDTPPPDSLPPPRGELPR